MTAIPVPVREVIVLKLVLALSSILPPVAVFDMTAKLAI